MRPSFRAGLLAGLACAFAALAATAAHAHQPRVSFEQWGGFGTGAANCQSAIARAAVSCSSRAVALRQACLMQTLSGATCDEKAVSAGIENARARARAAVQRTCTEADVLNLRYIDISEAMTDVIDICRQQEDAVSSSVFNPVTLSGGAGVESSKRSCIRATSTLSARLLRVASRLRRSAFDEIASNTMSPDARRAGLARSNDLIASASRLLRRRFDAACPADAFRATYGRSADDFFAAIARRADCLAGTVYVQSELLCPAPVCPNGMQESGEQCDDGNEYDGDLCRKNCQSNDCDLFPSTYALIQRSIFENHGCTQDLCHGSARSGDLDLRAGASYAELIDKPANTVLDYKRVNPGDKDGSLLWINLAARTLPDQYHAPLRGMPLLGDPITTDELEAVRVWIETGGASETVTVPGTDRLLHACLPEPVPPQIDPLAPPDPDKGIQMHMPTWYLEPHSESEVCYSSYFDFTGKIPDYALTEDGTHFRYKRIDIRQDPLSHHLIVDLYRGTEAPNDPVWGTYHCNGGPKDGQVCDPLNLGFCGTGDCATSPDPTAIACIGFGPQTGLSTLTSGGFAFAQETTAEFIYPEGVYNELPVKGVALWNSHAFNLTGQRGKLEGWVNITFPDPVEQVHVAQQIFNVSHIFWSNNFLPLPLPAFQEFEICNVHVFGSGLESNVGSALARRQKAYIFEISGHTHRHGKRFEIFRGTFTCKGGSKNGTPCSPVQPEMCPEGQCLDDGGRDPQDALLYTNFIYNDPVRVRFDPPMVFDGAAPTYDRSLTYCAHYSNGAPPNITDVKRQSTSPPAGDIFGLKIGGPCDFSQTRCIGGPHHNELCFGNDSACDSETGGDGDCDACPLTGGFRTEDEMFVLFGNYWVE